MAPLPLRLAMLMVPTEVPGVTDPELSSTLPALPVPARIPPPLIVALMEGSEALTISLPSTETLPPEGKALLPASVKMLPDLTIVPPLNVLAPERGKDVGIGTALLSRSPTCNAMLPVMAPPKLLVPPTTWSIDWLTFVLRMLLPPPAPT